MFIYYLFCIQIVNAIKMFSHSSSKSLQIQVVGSDPVCFLTIQSEKYKCQCHYLPARCPGRPQLKIWPVKSISFTSINFTTTGTRITDAEGIKRQIYLTMATHDGWLDKSSSINIDDWKQLNHEKHYKKANENWLFEMILKIILGRNILQHRSVIRIVFRSVEKTLLALTVH